MKVSKIKHKSICCVYFLSCFHYICAVCVAVAAFFVLSEHKRQQTFSPAAGNVVNQTEADFFSVEKYIPGLLTS